MVTCGNFLFSQRRQMDLLACDGVVVLAWVELPSTLQAHVATVCESL